MFPWTDKALEGIIFTRQSLIPILSLGSTKNHTVDVPSLTFTLCSQCTEKVNSLRLSGRIFSSLILVYLLRDVCNHERSSIGYIFFGSFATFVRVNQSCILQFLHNLKKTSASKRNLRDLYLGHCFVAIVIFNLRGCTLLTRSSVVSFTSLQRM